MKVRAFVFKTRKLKDGFMNRSESSNFVVKQYMNHEEDGIELHVSVDALQLGDRDGYISRYIVNGFEVIDEINSINMTDFENCFKSSHDYDLELEPVPVVEIDEDELYSAIMGDLDKPIKPIPVVVEKPVINEDVCNKQDVDSPWHMTGVLDLRPKPKDPTEYMIKTIADVMDKAQQYEMTITKGREGKQCLQLKVEW